MSSDEAMLGRWKAIAGDKSPGTWTEDDLAGFFQRFRPDGHGMSEAFEGVEGADEIVPRLLDVYEATADGWQREETHDGYFVVRNPAPSPPPVRRNCFACTWDAWRPCPRPSAATN